MPDLLQSLLDRDIGFLQIVSTLWGVDPPRTDSLAERSSLTQRLLEPDILTRTLSDLPENAARALADLQQNGGRILWTTFTRRYGDVREFGPGKRDREQPHLNPVSATEIVWYRALIARAFFKVSGRLQEYAFIPDDLQVLLPPPSSGYKSTSNSFPVDEDYLPSNCTDQSLDHFCTLLLLQRGGIPATHPSHLPISEPNRVFLESLLQSMDLIDEHGQPALEAIKDHLESTRGQALAALYSAWETSAEIDDLSQVPGVIIERTSQRSHVPPRREILDYFHNQMPCTWTGITDVILQIKSTKSEFLRPDGNFDIWQIRSRETGSYLQGYTHWEEVEGAYIHHLIIGPLFWLGMVELGYSSHALQPAAFRLTPAGVSLLKGDLPLSVPENGRVLIKSGAQVQCPPYTPRWVRYLLARMAEWEESRDNGYSYRFTPASLALARKQALHISHLGSLLRKYGAIPPPPSLMRAFQSWEQNGAQVIMESVQVLRVASPEIMQKITQSRANRYLSEPLGPTVVIIKDGSMARLSQVLIELGYLGEIKTGL